MTVEDPGQLRSKVVHDWHIADGAIRTRHIADRTRSVWLPAGVFTLAVGVPDLAVRGANTFYRAWALDAAAAESVVAEVLIRPDWASGAVTANLYWTNLGGGTGNVFWIINLKNAIDGTDLNSTAGITQPTITAAAPTVGVLKISTLSPTFTGASGLFQIVVQRFAADVADTLANDAGFIGVRFDYTADS